jgi:acyl transferase domain-containing protein/NAD(P)-dependent dehydrogenase (short-subunit alcohol dehydrogenase family)/acyl carrier protein
MTGSKPLSIAIVGMSCRLPGADSLEEFWTLLSQGRDAVADLPESLIDRALYYNSSRGQKGKTYSLVGGLISSIDQPEQVDGHDSCHRIFCQVATQACRHAGYSDEQLSGRPWGVYVGHSAGSSKATHLAISSLAQQVAQLLDDVPGLAQLDASEREDLKAKFARQIRSGRPQRDSEGGPDLTPNWAAVLVAEQLGLTGPVTVVDAACASSLVALSLAVLALESGEIEAAIVGGASMNKLESMLLFSQAQSCSATGSRPFDDQADGLVSSEGYVAMVLKPEVKAVQDGDRIWGVIRGIGISSDGRGKSLWAPNPAGQKAALDRAYGTVLDPKRIQYLEAHATSTQVGDATELESLVEFFGPHSEGRKIPIGSVKSNLGHTLETAGLASLLKVVLSMHHATIPPSLNVSSLNRSVDWSKAPLEVVSQCRSWLQPTDGRVRCAGVSAFGIGGLNVHLVVEQSDPAVEAAASAIKPDSGPIAIIGRGLVVPGAQSLAEFSRILAEGRSQIGAAPAERWPDLKQQQMNCAGGYIENLVFDCVKHKVAPRYVQTANPLQFMLWSAAEQALAEVQGDLDRLNTAVVVGSAFGGEFSDQLSLGLRFPELRSALNDVLAANGTAESGIFRLCLGTTEDILNSFEELFFIKYPALHDETGSFTSSTLASRLSKTYNLMGGAMALDCGECSGHLAIKFACDLLNQGACKTVLCAGGQRAMNFSAYELLHLQGKLAGSGDQGYLPGEGAGVVVLKRLADAQRDGNLILGVVEGTGAGFGTVEAATRLALERASLGRDLSGSLLDCGTGAIQDDLAELRGFEGSLSAAVGRTQALIPLLGHLQSAQGLISLIRATLQATDQQFVINGRANAGQACCILVKAPSPKLEVPLNGQLLLGAASLAELKRQVIQGVSRGQVFHGRDGARLAILFDTPKQLESKLQLAAQREWDLAGRQLMQEQGIFLSEIQPRARLAFVFAGQGSQYAGMLSQTAQSSPAAAAALERANLALAKLGHPSFEAMVASSQLDSDPVVTQLVVLVADYVLYSVVQESGIAADCLCGHSFGEIPALVAADVITIEEALELTEIRARALLQASPDGGLLSVSLSAQTLEQHIAGQQLDLYITHINSPKQTVAGGRLSDLEKLKTFLEERKIACRGLRVPGALHTPLVEPALRTVSEALERLEFRPPTKLFYSNASNRPCHDPAELRRNLLDQLVTPMRFVDLQQRLYADGVRAFLEIGPGQVLTKLMRHGIAERGVLLLCTDHPQRTVHQQLGRALIGLETLGLRYGATGQVDSRNRHPILEFDATAARRSRRRDQAAEELSLQVHTAVNTPAKAGREDSPLSRFLIDYLVDLTGFSKAVIDPDWDLEADLGIDSIKRMQLFGELKELFSVEASDRQLVELRSVNQILDFVQPEALDSSPPPSVEQVASAQADELDPELYETGRQYGLLRQGEIRKALRSVAAVASLKRAVTAEKVESQFSLAQRSRLQGMADGAGVHIGSLLAYQLRWESLDPTDRSSHAAIVGKPSNLGWCSGFESETLSGTYAAVSGRYLLSMRECPRVGESAAQVWHGSAIILGDNRLARLLQKRLAQSGCPTEIFDCGTEQQQLLAKLDACWLKSPAPHLFIATPHDEHDLDQWDWLAQRRAVGLETPFWFCQHWLKLVKQAGMMDRASLVGLPRLGGDFGVTGSASSFEGGALCGLLKSISIESWVDGHHTFAVKLVDWPETEPLESMLDEVLGELAHPSYDREIGFHQGQRRLLWAHSDAIDRELSPQPIQGNWVCTGGARGITAYVASQMARRFGLKLHLIGRAPAPQVPESWASQWPENRRQLRLQVMEEGRAKGLNSVRYWEEVEKALEIDLHLREYALLGIEAHYYSCNLSDRDELAQTLEKVRQHGSIDGILHGAGASRDAKFENKDRTRVQECFASKIDGTLNLMELTASDPLRFFVGFGSISGRFGANGHADYSLANDMLAKLIGWYRGRRPEVGALTFHWHAWGDVGMAVKGETQLGLERIDMQFMPAVEGLEHLIAELHSGATQSEVLVTSPRYVRQFFHSDRFPSAQTSGRMGALLGDSQQLWLDPNKDIFLRDHLMQGKPVLPLAVSLQLLWEAANSRSWEFEMQDVEAPSALKFFDSNPRLVKVSAQEQSGSTSLRLSCEIRTRNGELVDAQRPIASARLMLVCGPGPRELSQTQDELKVDWAPVFYHERQANMFHGPTLRCLKRVRRQDHLLLGEVVAPALYELCGSHRPVEAWRVPSAVLDACFYGAAILAWHTLNMGQAVPQRIAKLWIGRCPIPGEVCLVRVRLEQQDSQGGDFSFTLYGADRQPLIWAEGYRMLGFQGQGGTVRED